MGTMQAGPGYTSRRRIVASVLALAVPVAAAPAADLASQVREALEELRVDSEGQSHAQYVDKASAALEIDAILPALEHVADAHRLRARDRYTEAIAPKDGEAEIDFDTLRRDLGQRAGELLELIGDRASRGSQPAVVAGWIDVALARQKAYRDTAIGFADSGFPSASDDYLIRSLEQLEKAAFLLSFEYARPARPPLLPGLEAAINSTESQLLTHFTGTTADNRYPPTVVANSSIDFSRKLIDAGDPLAAALLYLDAATRLYDIVHAGDEALAPDRLAEAAEMWQSRVAAADGDLSIAWYFLQTARVDLSTPSADDAPRPHAVAEAALHATLPAYFKLLEGLDSDVASARNLAPVSTVTVLRYPYT